MYDVSEWFDTSVNDKSFTSTFKLGCNFGSAVAMLLCYAGFWLGWRTLSLVMLWRESQKSLRGRSSQLTPKLRVPIILTASINVLGVGVPKRRTKSEFCWFILLCDLCQWCQKISNFYFNVPLWCRKNQRWASKARLWCNGWETKGRHAGVWHWIG